MSRALSLGHKTDGQVRTVLWLLHPRPVYLLVAQLLQSQLYWQCWLYLPTLCRRKFSLGRPRWIHQILLTYFQHQGSPVYFSATLIVCTHQSWDSQRNATPVQGLSCWQDWQHLLVYWLLLGIYEKNDKSLYRIDTRCTNNWRNVVPYMVKASMVKHQ